ncbi:amidohydrolase [Arhodomonas sp. AD133]|uniref:amidohydrolase n=1 Tax=Arhodomonas sp. AD133 TaxID=3415009 RepID=UPI003EB97CDF
MDTLTLSLVQSDLHWQRPQANRQRLGELMAPLAGHTDLVVLPEMFATGFTMAPEEHAESADGPSLAWMREQARHLQATVTGSLAVREGVRYHNRLYWVSPAGDCLTYDKRHCFRMAGEHNHYTPGTQRMTTTIRGWRVCPLICYDLRFPVWSRSHDDYDLLLYVANWPAVRRSSWQRLLPARAIENLCVVAAVNRVGEDGNGKAYAGDSAVVDWLGDPLVSLDDTEAVRSVTLQPEGLRRYRERFPAHLDADPFTLGEC